MFKLLCLITVIFFSPGAAAYIGPGAGISVLGSLLAVLGTILLAIGAILFWPIRKLLKRGKGEKAGGDPESKPGSTD